jgi:hypothetical protein
MQASSEMIATWPTGELFVTTTPLAKHEMLKMPDLKKSNQKLVNSA